MNIAFSIKHGVDILPKNNNTFTLKSDWFTLNGEYSFDINKLNLVKSLIVLDRQKYVNISMNVEGKNINPLHHINIDNLKINKKYFTKLIKAANNTKYISKFGIMPATTAFLETIIVAKFFKNCLKFYVAGFKLFVDKKLVLEFNDVMSYNKVIPLEKDCFVQSNFSEKHQTLFTDNKTYTLQIKSEHSKNYELNKKTYKKMFNDLNKLYYISDFTTLKIKNISFISNMKTGYSFLIECENDENFIIVYDEIKSKVLIRG